MDESQLRCVCTASTATLYWKKPKEAHGNTFYEIWLNGMPMGTATRTHFTFKDLQPDSSHRVEVRMKDALVGTCKFHTTPRRYQLDVTAFGAVGDGQTMNTLALQKAIDNCSPEQEIYFPAGVYLTGALRLHSNMALYLSEGAVLQGTDRPEDYLPRIPSRFEGIETDCYSSLLNLGDLDHTSGPNCQNVLIYGEGTIASGGQALATNVIESERERLKDYLADNAELVASCENDRTIPGRVRPRLINLSNCQNVRISGLTPKNGACWNVHMIYCDHILTDHCTFISENVWNGDGWDPDSSKNCTLFACQFYTEDDSVAIKSGKNPEGNIINRPSQHIWVFDCFSACGHGICMGSEMSGGIEDVSIWDCDLANSLYGVEIKGTRKRGGYIRGIHVRDCTLPRVMLHSVGYNDDGIPAEHPPVFEGCCFERLQLTGHALDHRDEWSNVTPIELIGFDIPGYEARDIQFLNCVLTCETPEIRLRCCRQVRFENLICQLQANLTEEG